MSWLIEKHKVEPIIVQSLSKTPTSHDGNCLFESVSILLKYGLEQNYNVVQLRQIVAQKTLDATDYANNEYLKSTLQIYQDALKNNNIQLLRETCHLEGIEEFKFELNETTRALIYKNMMKSSFWGDQNAIRILEEYFQIWFLILSTETQDARLMMYHQEGFYPQYYAILWLNHNHYEPMFFKYDSILTESPRDTVLNDNWVKSQIELFNRVFIFPWIFLPYSLQLLFHQTFKK